jgi:hypothetical protein
MDVRFDEVQRREPFDSDFRARRRAWAENRLESATRRLGEAAQRLDEAVRDHAALSASLVIGSHGIVLTAWLLHARAAFAAQAAGAF